MAGWLVPLLCVALAGGVRNVPVLEHRAGRPLPRLGRLPVLIRGAGPVVPGGWWAEARRSRAALDHVAGAPAGGGPFANHDPAAQLSWLFPDRAPARCTRLAGLLAGGGRYWSGPPERIGLPAGGRCIERAWLGQAGVVAQAHYDGYDNMFSQMAGRKRMLLLPPSALPAVRLYPGLHPSYRSARLLLPDALRQPALASLAGQLRDVQLRPGDQLWLPALWLHQAEALGGALPGGWTLARSAWCPSPVIEPAERAFELPMPFESDWPPGKTRAALGGYLPVLAAAVVGARRVGRFWTGLTGRFAGLGGYDWAHKPGCGGDMHPELTNERARWERAAGAVAGQLGGLEDGAREVYLQDLVEQMVGFFLAPELVPQFVATCLAGT